MDNESSISLGGTIREIFFWCRKYTPLYKKGIKENKNKTMETTEQSMYELSLLINLKEGVEL